MVFLLEIVVEALFWVVVLILRLLLELVAEVLMRGLIWLLAWVFRSTGRQLTLGSRSVQLMVGVRLANAGWYEEALSVLPARADDDDPADARSCAFTLARAWIFARQGEWDDVKLELEFLTRLEVIGALQPRCLPLVAELAWAAGEREAARSALSAAVQDDWTEDRSATFDDLQSHWSAEPDLPPPAWPAWPSKLRIKWGPISVGEQRLHRAARRLRWGWRNAGIDKKRKRARGKLEKAAETVPGSVVALLAEAELPRLKAEAGMYR